MGAGSGHGTKRPDHPGMVTGRTKRNNNFYQESEVLIKRGIEQPKHPMKNGKSLFSDKPDPSCHNHRRERNRLVGIPDYSQASQEVNRMRLSSKEAVAAEMDRRKTIAMEARDLQDLARQLANKAMQALVEILDSDESPAAAKLQAIQVILDRGYGKAATTNVNVNASVDANVSELDAKSLDKRIAETLARAEKLTNGAPEEGESEIRPADLRKYN